MDIKKLNGLFDKDSNRVVFFAWSHLFGWFIAWIQTVWIIILMKRYKKSMILSLTSYSLLGIISSLVGTILILLNIQKIKNRQKNRRGY
jgi:hypothetical protein